MDSSSGLSEVEVRQTITQHAAGFRRCYEKGAMATPGFSGMVSLRVAISAQGSVASVDVLTSTTRNQTVDACVSDEVKKLQFPAKGGGAMVAFPIEFGR
ncbi:MAG: AgmX/PglI C-terminal domain-containing protein [Polyangiaceae bacterium]